MSSLLADEALRQFQNLRETMERRADLDRKVDKLYSPKKEKKKTYASDFHAFDLNIAPQNRPFNIRRQSVNVPHGNRSYMSTNSRGSYIFSINSPQNRPHSSFSLHLLFIIFSKYT